MGLPPEIIRPRLGFNLAPAVGRLDLRLLKTPNARDRRGLEKLKGFFAERKEIDILRVRKLTLKWFSPKQVLSKTWIEGEAEKCHVSLEQEGEDLRIEWVREFPGLAPKTREMQVRVVYTPLNFGGERS